MADPLSFTLSADHPLHDTTVTYDEFVAVLRYLQPAAGSGLKAVVDAWAVADVGVVAKTGSNTSEAIGYEALRQNIENNTAYQTLTGAGTINVTSHVTHLNNTSGSYALAIDQGSYDGQEKIVLLTNNVTTAEFTLSANFFDWNTLVFKQGARCAVLRWVAGSNLRWCLVGGNVEAS